jgi:hypothetical protein
MPHCYRIKTVTVGLAIWTLFSGISIAEAAAKLQMRDGLPVVEGVYLNGQGPFRFLLDTGAAMNQMLPSLTNKLGLAPTFKSQLASSVTGWSFVLGAGGIRVAVDGAQADDQRFLFAGLESLQLGPNDIQGVLGQEFLSRFDYLLDIKGKRLQFGAPALVGTTATRIAFSMLDGRPAVDTSLGRLILDSAADSVIRFNVGGGVIMRQIATLTGTAAAAIVRSSLVIDGRKVWNGDAVVVASRAGAADGLLPVNLFDRVYVSNSEGFLLLE